MRWESFVWEDAKQRWYVLIGGTLASHTRKGNEENARKKDGFCSKVISCGVNWRVLSIPHSKVIMAVEEHRMIHTRHIPKLRPVEWLRNNFILHILKLQSRLGTPQLSCRKGTSVHLNNEADTENIIHVRRQVIPYTCTDSIHLNSNTGTEKTWSYWHSRL